MKHNSWFDIEQSVLFIRYVGDVTVEDYRKVNDQILALLPPKERQSRIRQPNRAVAYSIAGQAGALLYSSLTHPCQSSILTGLTRKPRSGGAGLHSAGSCAPAYCHCDLQ